MSDDKRLNEIKKEDSKKKPIFYIVLVIGCTLGGILGYLMASKQELIDKAFDLIKSNPRLTSVIATAVLILFG